MGIPSEMLARVFDKLASDPDKDGMGLGLAIVKQIVVAYDRQVSAVYTPSAGATLRSTLPTPRGS